MSARVLVERFEQEKNAGLKANRDGAPAQARTHFLKAAECLYKLAGDSGGALRESRVRNAEKLVALAQRLPTHGDRPRTAAREGGEGGGGESDWLMVERPGVRFDDIAGLEAVKEEILVKMVYPFTHAQAAERLKVARGGGVLLWGPPGTGKTLLAKAVAGELDAPFYTVMPSEIMSKWVGESEQNIERLFEAARSHERAVVFIDEIDAILPSRSDDVAPVMRRVVPQILSELEGVRGKGAGALMFLGATNEPWALDPAAMRPGRFDRRIFVGLPDATARAEILRIHLRGRPVADDVCLETYAAMSAGYSGADLRAVVERAANTVFLQIVGGGEERDINGEDLADALGDVRPSVTLKHMARFDEFMRDHGAGE